MAGLSDFYRGDTQRYRLVIKDSNGNPIDLTDKTIWFTMKTSVTQPDSEAVIQKKVTNHTDPANGVTEITLEASDTDSLNPTKYVYDIQMVDNNGNVKTLLSGVVKVLADVTRRTT